MTQPVTRGALFLSVAFMFVSGTAHAADPSQGRTATVAGWQLSDEADPYGDRAFLMTHTVGPVAISWSHKGDSGRASVSSSKCALAGWSNESDLSIDETTPQPLTTQAKAFITRAITSLAGDCADEKADADTAFQGFDEAASTLDSWAQPSEQGR